MSLVKGDATKSNSETANSRRGDSNIHELFKSDFLATLAPRLSTGASSASLLGTSTSLRDRTPPVQDPGLLQGGQHKKENLALKHLSMLASGVEVSWPADADMHTHVHRKVH